MTDVLTKLVNLWPASRFAELMPWAYPKITAANNSVVECVTSCKLVMGSGEAIPSEPPSLASPGQGERGGGEGVASIPLVDLSEAQAAVFSFSRCASFRNAMLR